MTDNKTSTWQIDAAHSTVGFAIRHLMISTVRGRFRDVTGQVVLNALDPSLSRISAEIKTASIDTGEPNRDAHLRSADFFDAEKYPLIRFESTGVEGNTDGEFTVTGDLTIRDVTRRVQLKVNAEGRGMDPWGGERAAFAVETKIKRSDFGLTWNQALETGGVVVGDEVKITIETELVKKAEIAQPVAA